MLVSDIFTKAITELFNDTGSASGGAISNQMVYDWINAAINDYWAKISNNEFGYFAVRQSGFPNGASQTFAPLNIVSGTGVYVLPNQSTTTNTTSQSIAKITRMFLRMGSGIPYAYQEILPVGFPTDRYYNFMSNYLQAWVNTTGNSPVFQWSANIGGLDASMNPTISIEFSPVPMISGTVVFDGYRYPAKVAALTDVPDLPEHLHQGIVYRVAKMASVFDKAQWPEIDQLIKDFDVDHLPMERRSVQAQGPLVIKDVQGW